MDPRRHGQVCLINPNFLRAVLPRTAISAKNSWSPGTIAYDRGGVFGSKKSKNYELIFIFFKLLFDTDILGFWTENQYGSPPAHSIDFDHLSRYICISITSKIGYFWVFHLQVIYGSPTFATYIFGSLTTYKWIT